MGSNAFVLKNPEVALTYNIKTKKVYGGSGGMLLLDKLTRKENTKDILKSLGWEFLMQVPSISSFWNQTVIKGLFGGKIKNNRDLLKVYFASSYRIKNIETTLLLKLLADLKGSNHPISTVKKALQVGVDRQNTFLNFFHFMGYPHATDLLGQAFLLKQKIDFSWSHKRLDNCHAQWTKEIILLSAKYVPNECINYDPVLLTSLSKGYFTVLSEKLSFYIEGKELQHCIYTSGDYWQRVKERKSLVLKYADPGSSTERGTAEITFNGDGLMVRQFFGRCNTGLSNEASKRLKSYLAKHKLALCTLLKTNQNSTGL